MQGVQKKPSPRKILIKNPILNLLKQNLYTVC